MIEQEKMMIQKNIAGLILLTILFIGVILAQNSNRNDQNNYNSNSQSNSNISTSTFNANRGITSRPWKPKYESRPKPKSQYCKALSTSDAEKIVGYKVEFREEKEKDGQVSCRYEKGGRDDGLNAEFQTFADSKKAKRVLTLERESTELANVSLPDSKFLYKTQIIQRVGDNAWIEQVNGSITLWVQKGTTVFSLSTAESGKFSHTELKRIGNKLSQQFAVLKPTQSNLNQMIETHSNIEAEPTNSTDSDKLNFPFNVPEEKRNSPIGKRSVACDYLTESDAKSLTNQSVIFYTSTTYENELQCLYTQRNEFFPSVGLKATTYKTAKQAQAAQLSMIKIVELVNLRLAQDDSRIETLAEIGDVASLVTNGKNGANIYCQKGKTKFEIEVLDLKGKTVPSDVLKSIAKKVAEKF